MGQEWSNPLPHTHWANDYRGHYTIVPDSPEFVIDIQKFYSPKRDTIPCIMLVCDTSTAFYITTKVDSNLNYIPQRLVVDGRPYWAKGFYTITDPCPNCSMTVDENGISKYDHRVKKYLYANRTPLSKNIIVWMVK
jgi:hypothetical protein